MDSAFATVELLTEVELLGASVSISLKSNRTAGFGALYTLATMGLRSGEVRSYAIQRYLLQSRRQASALAEDGEKTHVVLSSGWRVPSAHDEPIKRLLAYDTVVYLYLSEPAEALSLAFKAFPYRSKRDLLLDCTHWDVLAPPPGDDGRIAWTQESLSKMKVPLLRDLHTISGAGGGTSKKPAAVLIEEILAHHPHARPSLPPALDRRPLPKDIVALRQHVGPASSVSAPVLDFYSSEYGAVDQVNQEIYRSILLSGHHSWEKLLGFSVLHALCMNAWAECVEARAVRASRDAQGRRMPVAHTEHQSFAEFMFAACKQFVARK
jgi:hypothetical protein